MNVVNSFVPAGSAAAKNQRRKADADQTAEHHAEHQCDSSGSIEVEGGEALGPASAPMVAGLQHVYLLVA
jgi:hypothetical protein